MRAKLSFTSRRSDALTSKTQPTEEAPRAKRKARVGKSRDVQRAVKASADTTSVKKAKTPVAEPAAPVRPVPPSRMLVTLDGMLNRVVEQEFRGPKQRPELALSGTELRTLQQCAEQLRAAIVPKGQASVTKQTAGRGKPGKRGSKTAA